MTNTTAAQPLDLDKLIALIADDGYACSFQSMGQYRTALIAQARAARLDTTASASGEREGWEAAAKTLSERAAGHFRNKNYTLQDECLQCASMLHDMKPGRATLAPVAAQQAVVPKCATCNDTRCVYNGPVGDPPSECEACFDQEPDLAAKAPAAQAIADDPKFQDLVNALLNEYWNPEPHRAALAEYITGKVVASPASTPEASQQAAAIAGAAPALEKLPQWIDDLKGKDPTIDDLITYILYVRALAARYSTKVDQLLAAPAPAPAPATAGMVEDAKDAARLDFLEQIAERKEDSMPNVRAFGKTFVAETLREAIDAAMAAQQAQASAKGEQA